jgi:DNA-directed RNA polymerase specialized sigma24 family protein
MPDPGLNPGEQLYALVLAIARRKLGVYGGFSREEVEDVASEAMLIVVERTGAAATEGGPAPIADVEAYAATVAYTCCAHAIRQRHPERARLKGRVRYVLASHPRFAVWDDPSSGAVCGRSAWRGRTVDEAAHRALEALVGAPERAWPGGRMPDPATPAGLTACLDGIVTAVDGPVELDRLVACVARLTGAVATTVARDTDVSGAVGATIERREASLDDRRQLARVWAEIGELPIRQRIALLLHMRDHAGAGVLWLLPILGLASIRQIAAVLDIPALEMARLWGLLPLDDHAIARRLDCTRQQVINLRMAGRKRLATRLRATLGVDGQRQGRSASRGNLTVVSPSMEGES